MQKSDKPAEYTKCTAYGFLDRSLKEDCGIMAISLKGVSNGETKNEENSRLSLKLKLCLKHSAVKVPKRNYVRRTR